MVQFNIFFEVVVFLKMGKKSSLTEVQRAQIITLRGEGYTERQISSKLKFSKTAVHNAIKKYRLDGVLCDRDRCGRPRKTTVRDDNAMRRVVLRSPMSSCKKVKSVLQSKGTNISISTVSRRLSKEFKLPSRKPAKKPRLTETMMKKRLDFALRHQHWTVSQWQKVLFSDESSIQQFVARKRFVRRPKGKRFDAKYTVQTMKHPPSQMIWGAMSFNGRAGLYFLPPNTTMNGIKYVNLLEEKLILHMNIHSCTVFMQDGAPCHRSKVVKEFHNKNKINLLEWPGNSPDLNPIENLWYILKDKVAEKQPLSAEHLRQVITDVWVHEITPELCSNLVSSMPRRIQAVINAKGGHTKY